MLTRTAEPPKAAADAARFNEQSVFHLTGRRTSDQLTAVQSGQLPALLAQYRDLDRLRYDFPCVLTDTPAAVEPLSTIVDGLLSDMAPRGPEGELLRRHVLAVERWVRGAVRSSGPAPLRTLWQQGAEAVSASAGDAAREVLARTTTALPVDGDVVDCDPALPARLLKQQWRRVHEEKAARFRLQVDRLILRLTDILRAAFDRSEAGRRPDALRATVGDLHVNEFDFDALSRFITPAARGDELPAARRQRIEQVLSVLYSQPFYADPASKVETLGFEFDQCAAALGAYEQRLPLIVEVVKALTVGELEANGAYVETEHDALFEQFDAESLSADDLALFPDYLVCIAPDRHHAAENASLLAMLSSGLPVKVLVQLADLNDEAAPAGALPYGVRSMRLATTAMALGGLFVLQSPVSNLVALKHRIRHGLQRTGAALICVYAPAAAAGVPSYLIAAAAMDGRAFPAFSYDAQAGTNWAARFSLENNRDCERDWPLDAIGFADEELQRQSTPLAFSFADYALLDRRQQAHFAVVARERWTESMLPATEWLALDEPDASMKLPYVWLADAENRLHRALVDSRLMQSTRRALLLWRRLQEHAGIHDSHAERLLAQERARWQAQAVDAATEAAAVEAAPTPVAATAAAPGINGTGAETAVARDPDLAWIDTARCPSCNECQIINDRMFGYNENKQAYIKDIAAGTYRQLVEAAEACQVAIIHPGKPRDPNEPGLQELLERARPFA